MKTKSKKFWSLTQSDTSAELILYGEISDTTWWGDEITPQQFAQDLADLSDVTDINVRINSGGGDVFAGMAIYSMLQRHSANITVYVDGLAASIASIIAMAGDQVIMPKGAMMMIHNPWSSVWGGDATDFRHMADVLDKIKQAMLDVYTSKSSLSVDEISSLLDAETWMTAQEAVDSGFADVVEESTPVAASIRGKTAFFNNLEVDWTRFLHPPELPKQKEPVSTKNDAKSLDLMRKRLDLKAKGYLF